MLENYSIYLNTLIMFIYFANVLLIPNLATQIFHWMSFTQGFHENTYEYLISSCVKLSVLLLIVFIHLLLQLLQNRNLSTTHTTTTTSQKATAAAATCSNEKNVSLWHLLHSLTLHKINK